MTTKIDLDLDYNELASGAARRAAADAFGLNEDIMVRAANKGLQLRATMAQFGTYIALRNAYGGTNSIKSLNPRLIPNPISHRVDVTGYPLAA